MSQLKKIYLDNDQIKLMYELLDGLEGDEYRYASKVMFDQNRISDLDKTCDRVHMIEDIKAILKNVYEEKK